MNRFACIFVAFGLAAAGSTALAASAKPQPMLMTDAQMDNVTAGLLTIVFQDSFNNWTINLDDSAATSTASKTALPRNGNAKGWEHGKGNPHQSASASKGASSSKHGDTFLFTVNIAANVNAAIAGGDATAIQTVGTQTQTLTATVR